MVFWIRGDPTNWKECVGFLWQFWHVFLFDSTFRLAYVCVAGQPTLSHSVPAFWFLQRASAQPYTPLQLQRRQSSLSSSTTEATEIPGSHAPVAARAGPASSAGEGRGHHRAIVPSDLCYGLGHDQA